MNLPLRRRAAGMALLLGLAPSFAEAQSLPTSPFHLGAGATLESYTFADPEQIGIESLQLLAAPFGARARVGFASLTLSGYFAEGTLQDASGASTSITGLTDTQLQIDVPIADESIIVSGIVALPTGQPTLALNEAVVAGAFAADLLPFRVSNWGTGGAFGLATSYARSVGDFGLGFSVGYSVAQEFEPLSDDERAYQPGNELRLRGALDRTVGNSGKASLQLTAHRYDEDALGGQNLYQSGDRYSAVGSYAFAAGGRGSGVAYLGVLHRTEGTFFGQDDVAPSQDLVLAGGGFRVPLGGLTLVPSADARLFRSADGVGQGYISGFGASLELPLGGLTLVPSGRARVGNVVADAQRESAITGYDAGLMVRFGGAR